MVQDQTDQEELQTLSGANVESGYMTDLTLEDSESDATTFFKY